MAAKHLGLCNAGSVSCSLSQFRPTALSSHDSLASHDFRRPAKSGYAQHAKPRSKQAASTAAYMRAALGPDDNMPKTELNTLQAMRMKTQHNSEWALLDTYEAHLCQEDHTRRAQRKADDNATTRAFLDSQMHVRHPCSY